MIVNRFELERRLRDIRDRLPEQDAAVVHAALCVLEQDRRVNLRISLEEAAIVDQADFQEC